MSRRFLLCNLSGEWVVHALVLSYDPCTGAMRVRVKNGIEYDRIFLADSKYNRSDFLLRDEDDYAKLPELRQGHPAGEANGQAPG